MTASDTNDFLTKQGRSPSLDDLRSLFRMAAKLEESTEGFLKVDVEVVVGHPEGYVIGAVWWDDDNELWRVDLDRFGEALA